MCIFPNIQYVDNYQPLNNPQNNNLVLPRGPRAMYTLLVNQGFVPANFLTALNVVNMTQLEDVINQKICNYGATDPELKEIFCLIHIWGGNTGRRVFIMNPDPNMTNILIQYRIFVNTCLTAQAPINNTLDAALDAALNSTTSTYNGLLALHNTIRGLGPAFLTKHARFWLTKINPRNPLPIYDSTFANHIMGHGPHCSAQFNDIIPFWNGMINKARLEHVSLLSLERQLFNHYN